MNRRPNKLSTIFLGIAIGIAISNTIHAVLYSVSDRASEKPEDAAFLSKWKADLSKEKEKANNAEESRLVSELLAQNLDESVSMLPVHVKNNLLRAQATGNDVYFEHAERDIDLHWNTFILPNLPAEADYSYVLEIAPGHGRNTAKILTELRAEKIIGIDINPDNIAFLKNRFASISSAQFIRTNGVTIPASVREGITFVYCWDAMVHFDKDVIGLYLAQVSKLMKPGAKGFIHHSQTPKCPQSLSNGFCSDPASIGSDPKNPHQRNANSKEEFALMAEEAGLEILNQVSIVWDQKFGETDAISTFRKPNSGGQGGKV